MAVVRWPIPFTLIFNPPPVFSLGTDTTLCSKETLQLNTNIANALYQWQDGSATNSFTVTSPGIYWLQVQKDGCTVRDSLMVGYYGAELLDLGPDVRLCAGDDTLITATGNFVQYNWSNGTTGAGIQLTAPGNYIVTATTIDGCNVKDTIALLAPFPLPIVQLDHTTSICAGETRMLNAGSGFTNYQWNDGSAMPTKAVTGVGNYSVTVTDNNGCKGTDDVAINIVVPLPADFLPADTALCSYGSINLVSLKTYPQYLWSTNATTPGITVTTPGTYRLTVTDQYNCKGTGVVVISSKDCMLGLYVPNAFSPDNNGINDVFKPLLFGNILRYEFSIYNRYGQVMFRSSKPGAGWDGRYKSTLQPQGAYVWTCTYQLDNGPVSVTKGTVMLIR